jgi:hypothetical protein
VVAVAVGGQEPPPPSAPVPSQSTEPASQVWSLEPMEGRLICFRCSFIIKIAMPISIYVITMPTSIYVRYMHGLFVHNQSGFLYGVVRYRMIKTYVAKKHSSWNIRRLPHRSQRGDSGGSTPVCGQLTPAGPSASPPLE